MQPYMNVSSRRTPPPDVVRSSQVTSPPRRPSPHAEFLIIGLFALRLTKRLIQGLDNYPRRDDDISWLDNFLAPYPFEFALAKICGARKQDYIVTYQEIVSRMKRQPRYPIRFMQMNPDQSMRHQQGSRGVETEGTREMTDREVPFSSRLLNIDKCTVERLDIIDFCDTAGEWGSVVPIPAKQAERMIELADQRRIADADNRMADAENRTPARDDRRYHEVY